MSRKEDLKAKYKERLRELEEQPHSEHRDEEIRTIKLSLKFMDLAGVET